MLYKLQACGPASSGGTTPSPQAGSRGGRANRLPSPLGTSSSSLRTSSSSLRRWRKYLRRQLHFPTVSPRARRKEASPTGRWSRRRLRQRQTWRFASSSMIPGDAIRSAHGDGSTVAMCSSVTPDMPARQRLIIGCHMIRAGMGRPSRLHWPSPMVDMASPCPNPMRLGWRGTHFSAGFPRAPWGYSAGFYGGGRTWNSCQLSLLQRGIAGCFVGRADYCARCS